MLHLADGRYDLVGQIIQFGIRCVRHYAPEHLDPTRPVATMRNQPARAFGQPEAHDRIDQRGNRFNPEHPAPGVVAHTGQQCIGEEGDQDAEHNIKLEHARQLAAILRRGDFGDIQRRRHGRDPDAETADKAGHHEGVDFRRIGRADSRNKVEDADREQGFTTTQLFRRPAADQRTDHRTPQRHADRQPVHRGVQAPKFLNSLLRTGDDHGIKPEKKTGQRRGQRPEKQFLVMHSSSLSDCPGSFSSLNYSI